MNDLLLLFYFLFIFYRIEISYITSMIAMEDRLHHDNSQGTFVYTCRLQTKLVDVHMCCGLQYIFIEINEL